jgi:16S rRNA (adenine1518-N6/adenine1519-N6)-dimethyltransferase
MDVADYKRFIRSIGAHRSFGQNFLVSKEIAAMEARYAKGLNVVEFGPGLGILTKELCRTARMVVAIEKDRRLFDLLSSELSSSKLRLINSDFFDVDANTLGKIDIMVSNIPYNLTSKVIYWLGSRDIPALLCVQKEFAEHMLAKPDTRNYSKLSVMAALRFKVHRIRDVHAGNFYPMPRVDSCIVYLAPKGDLIGKRASEIISLIMSHKKKRLRNAIIDSAKGLGITKGRAKAISAGLDEHDARPFQLEPQAILRISERVASLLDQNE